MSRGEMMKKEKITMKKSLSFNTKFTVLCAVLPLLFVFHLSALELAPIALSETLCSANTAAGHPCEYAADGDVLTGWALAEGETSGWITLRLAYMVRLYGIELKTSRIPENARVGVSFTSADGSSRPFFSALSRTLSSGSTFIDLSPDAAAAQELTVEVYSPTGEELVIDEIEVYGNVPGERPEKLTPERISASESTSYYSSEYNLIDGVPETYWMSERNAKWQNIHWAVLEILKNRREYDREQSRWGEGFVHFTFDKVQRMKSIKLFITDAGSGYYDLEVSPDGKSWQTLCSRIALDDSGWIEYPLASFGMERIKEAKVRTYDEKKNESGGIGEVEFWGYNAAPSSNCELNSAPFALPLGPEFSWDSFQRSYREEKKPSLMLALPKQADSVYKIRINGESAAVHPAFTYEDYAVVIFSPDERQLREGTNFIEFEKPAAALATAVLRGESSEVLHDSENGLLDGALFSVSHPVSGEIILPEAVLVERIEVYSAAGSYVRIGYDDTVTGECDKEAVLADSGSVPCVFSGGFTARNLRILSGNAAGITELRIYGSRLPSGIPEITLLYPYNMMDMQSHEPGWKVLAGVVSDPDSTVVVSGRKAQLYGNIFWIELKDLHLPQAGEADIVIKATGKSGVTAVNRYTLVLEHNGYPVSFDQPELVYTSSDTFRLSGRANQWTVKMFIDGTAVPIDGMHFSRDLPLSPGLNLFPIEFRDRNNRKTVFVREQRVFRLERQVRLVIQSPGEGIVTRERELTVRGYTRGIGEISLRVNGSKVPVIDNYFTSEVSLAEEGENRITIVSRDSTGATETAIVTVVRDTVSPALLSVFPSGGTILNTSTVGFSGTVSADRGTRVFVNGTVASSDGTSFAVPLDFPDGYPEISVYAVDQAGNRSPKRRLSLIIDTTAPRPFSLTADPAVWTNTTRPVLSFDTSDATSGLASYGCSIDGGKFVPAESPYTLPPLSDGVHDVIVRAVDKAGWMTPAAAQVFIDTTPPGTPSEPNLIPGDNEIRILWGKTEADTILYQVTRSPAWAEGAVRRFESTLTTCTDIDVTNGERYSYTVSAVDRAYNESAPTDVLVARAGVEVEPYEAESGAFVEYKGVELTIPPSSLPSGASAVLVTEVENELFARKALSPIIGSVKRIEVLGADGETPIDAGELEKPYLCSFSYDRRSLPVGFPEENLAVYYFEPLWSKWIEIPSSAVDTENHIIYFTSSHFSEYVIQTPAVKELSPEELQAVGYSPFSTYIQHADLSISPQGGTALTSVTELVLPGPAGFDLTLCRQYDFSIAKMDSQTAGNPWALPYAENQGDLAYSMGQGWRLDLPYIKDGNREPLLVLPGGSIQSLYGLAKPVSTEFFASDGKSRTALSFEGHDGQDFTLRVVFRKETTTLHTDFILSSLALYEIESAELTMRDGTSYLFDSRGRTVRITDPTGLNSIGVSYKPDLPEIDEICDTLGRKLIFTYGLIEDIPYIKTITVENDGPYKRSITYTQDEHGLLKSAVDASGRLWNYDYTLCSLVGSEIFLSFRSASGNKALRRPGYSEQARLA